VANLVSSHNYSLGLTILSAYTLHFRTHLFSILPPSFARGFKKLCASTLPPTDDTGIAPYQEFRGPALWVAFETLGLVDRYESLVASVGYEHIEAHVVSTCTGKWSEPMLSGLRNWMADEMVPWMLLPYARGATTS
jgi:anaphase-promoting complex subunit 2